MPWISDCKFVTDALGDRFTMTELCEGYGVSRRIGYDPVFRAQNGYGPDDGRPAITHDEGDATHRRSAELGVRSYRPLRMSINNPEARHVFVRDRGRLPLRYSPPASSISWPRYG